MLTVMRYIYTVRTAWRREEGATMVEYGLMVALIALVVAATVYAVGGGLDTLFGDVEDCVGDPTSC